VVQYVTSKQQAGEPVDVTLMAREITRSLIDMVLSKTRSIKDLYWPA
jgi:hypothetical protein